MKPLVKKDRMIADGIMTPEKSDHCSAVGGVASAGKDFIPQQQQQQPLPGYSTSSAFMKFRTPLKQAPCLSDTEEEFWQR